MVRLLNTCRYFYINVRVGKPIIFSLNFGFSLKVFPLSHDNFALTFSSKPKPVEAYSLTRSLSHIFIDFGHKSARWMTYDWL